LWMLQLSAAAPHLVCSSSAVADFASLWCCVHTPWSLAHTSHTGQSNQHIDLYCSTVSRTGNKYLLSQHRISQDLHVFFSADPLLLRPHMGDQASQRLARVAQHITAAGWLVRSSTSPGCSAPCPTAILSHAGPGPSLVRNNTSAPSSGSPGYTSAFPQATTAAVFPPAAHDALGLSDLLSPEEQRIQKLVRDFAVSA
jgi:hypothetical protein